HLLVLLSGGTSALVAAPPSTGDSVSRLSRHGRGSSRAKFTESVKEELHRVLVKAGLSIVDTNLIRRHCSGIKGGAALRAAMNAGKNVSVLTISDVYGDVPADIGSGPFAPDPTSFAAALQKAERVSGIPAPVMDHLRAAVMGQIPENLRPEELSPDRWRFEILARPGDALTIACQALEELEETVVPCPMFIDQTWFWGDFPFVRWVKRENLPIGTWVVAIGEAEVAIPATVRPGKGGRASHLVVSLACQFLQTLRPFELAVVATDGVDGTSDLGGGFLQTSDIEPFTIDHLQGTLTAFDSANFLQNIGRSFPGARSGTNFGDILLFRWLG
ncbi:MAG TPA: DUF4147 domain-containing protein, partial [Candidatus Ozemobacteraceae bacterium]|nr:DUF4147 domain-containing protein [Candidatus Ozemobacteraceae bacterium]